VNQAVVDKQKILSAICGLAAGPASFALLLPCFRTVNQEAANANQTMGDSVIDYTPSATGCGPVDSARS
jgi:hypothetical protein